MSIPALHVAPRPGLALLVLLLAFTPLVSACHPLDPVPEDLDGLLHYTWQRYDAGTDEELALAIVALDAAVDGPSLTEDPVTGDVTDLVREELDLVGMPQGTDPAEPRGLLLARTVACSLEDLEDQLIALDQGAWHPDAYLAYERRYTSDDDAYRAGQVDTLSWTASIDAEFLAGAAYHEDIEGGVRRVPDLGADRSPFGDVLLARTVMVEPADFDNDDYFFTQDYQIEVYYEPDPGRVVHVYSLWRWVGLLDATVESDLIASGILDGLSEWDDEVEAGCAG